MFTARARLRAALAVRTPVFGTFLNLPGMDAVELAAVAGLDLCVVDLEHSQLSDAQARDLVRHASALGLPALVRVPSVDPGLINRLLEAGAVGIQLSTLRSAAESTALRDAVAYPPGGRRSVSMAHPSAGHGSLSLAEYLAASAETPPILVGQIETADLDDPLDEVIAGLDVAFIGTTDLAVGLGLGATDAFTARVAEIRSTATTAGVVAGSWCASPAAAAAAVAAGDRYVLVGSDLQLLTQSMRNLAEGLK
jgi:4-hydroxy-2-oxoheptanedioate aldolase